MSNILAHSFDEYLNMVASFHGSPAPGVLIGGYMIDYAYRNLPEGENTISYARQRNCSLWDAVQLLTLCSIGNRWLKIIDVGRYALIFTKSIPGWGFESIWIGGSLTNGL